MRIDSRWYGADLEDQAGGRMEDYQGLVEKLTGSVPGDARLVVNLSTGKTLSVDTLTVGEIVDEVEDGETGEKIGPALSLMIAPAGTPVRHAFLIPTEMSPQRLRQLIA